MVRDDRPLTIRLHQGPLTRSIRAGLSRRDRSLGNMTRRRWFEERLETTTDRVRPVEPGHTLAVGDASPSSRTTRLATAPDIGRRMDVEHGEVLPAEARRRAVLIDGGRPDGRWGWQRGDGLGQLFNGFLLPRGEGLDQIARERHDRAGLEALARRVAEPHRL